MTFQCEECGKTLATEGGYEIHLQSHGGPAPAPAPMPELEATLPAPRQVRPPRPQLATASPPALLVMGLAAASALIFLVGMTAAVNPSLIRTTKHAPAAATAAAPANNAHGVPIPKVAGPATTPSTAATTNPTTPAASATTLPQGIGAQDDLLVRGLQLTQADFGPGWTFAQNTDAAAVDQAAAASGSNSIDQLVTCLGPTAADDNDSADVEGPAADDGALHVTSEGHMLRTETQTDMDILRGRTYIPCMKQFLTSLLQASGATVRSVSIVPFTPAASKVTAVAYRTATSISGPRGSATVYEDAVYLAQGRARAFAYFTSVGSLFPSQIERGLVLRLQDKVASTAA